MRQASANCGWGWEGWGEVVSDLSWMRPKLAELCGHTVSYLCSEYDRGLVCGDWRPDEDVAQAVRCLEAMKRCIDLQFDVVWHAQIGIEQFTIRSDISLPRAICLALAAALGWDKP